MNNLLEEIFNESELICVHTVKWFHVLLSDTNNFIYTVILC